MTFTQIVVRRESDKAVMHSRTFTSQVEADRHFNMLCQEFQPIDRASEDWDEYSVYEVAIGVEE